MKKLFKIQLLWLMFMSTLLFGVELIQGGGNDNGALDKSVWSTFGNTFGSLDRTYNGEQFIYATPKDTGSGMQQSFSTEVGKEYEVRAILIGSDTNRREVFNGESYLTVSSAFPVQAKTSVIAESEHVIGAEETSISFRFTATSTTTYLALRSDRQWHYASARAVSVKEVDAGITPPNDNPPLSREELQALVQQWLSIEPIGDPVDRRLPEESEHLKQQIENANVSQITDMSDIFSYCDEYHPFPVYLGILDLTNWDVSNVTNMKGMFECNNYNPHPQVWMANTIDAKISTWNVSNVRNMSYMFSGSRKKDSVILNSWDVSNVTNMEGMFVNSFFSPPIDNWDVSNVSNMNYMFRESVFNHPLNNWDVSNVTDMGLMFSAHRTDRFTIGAHFNQDISTWNVSNVINYDYFAGEAGSGYYSVLEDSYNPFLQETTEP